MTKHKLQKLVNQGLSAREIAREIDKCRTTVHYWLTKYGLKTNPKSKIKPRLCLKCGETDESKFYGHHRQRCSVCHNQRVNQKGKENKKKAVEYKGGKCEKCGYNKCMRALQFHHRNPALKDPNFSAMRGWAWNRIIKEIEKCNLVCSNCHSEIHDELDNRV